MNSLHKIGFCHQETRISRHVHDVFVVQPRGCFQREEEITPQTVVVGVGRGPGPRHLAMVVETDTGYGLGGTITGGGGGIFFQPVEVGVKEVLLLLVIVLGKQPGLKEQDLNDTVKEQVVVVTVRGEP